MAEREAKAVRAYTAANAASQRHGHYRQARDLFLSGERSISARTEAWEQSAQEWVVGWFKVMALADLQKDIPYAEFEAELQGLLREQSDGLLQLTNEAKAVKASADMALDLLGPANTEPVPPELSEYATVLQSLSQRENELRLALSQVGQIATSRLPRLETIANDSRLGVLARVRIALLERARYPLEQTLASVQALLTAEKVVDPILAKLTQAENDMNRYALNLQIFHVEESLTQARALCMSSQATLATLTSPASYVAAAKARATQLCTAIEGHATGLLSYGIPKADLVYEFINVEKASLGAICKIANPPVACEKLALLAALKLTDLQAMSDAKLRFVEYGWTEQFEAAQRN
ncbi:hypothetical protein [Archangium lipolyticum]|uniref:hypothetical protein n=1 Tax=Archangium lipolyticum TaxID=2970465 RepID=UPI00214A8A3D|nr:hypothetical protein [Archangium lipolyticum]